MNILLFKPIPRPALWGNTLLKDYFGYDDFPDGIGQSWAFSALENETTVCISEPFKGITLKELWDNHQELFGHPGEEFPVIISLLAPEEDLSIQVHPDLKHAKELGFSQGKNEAWYFIESKDNANIVYGHNAKNKEDLLNYINNDKWDDLIRHLDVKTGDFVYIPAGVLHAMRVGSIVYEIQQATDITYRFYDYHRKDENGNERELHLKQAIDCLSYDSESMKNDILPKEKTYENIKETEFISNSSFTVTRLIVTGLSHYQCDNYQLATVVRGKGTANNIIVKKGDSFLIPKKLKVELDGDLMIMMTTR